MNHVRSSATLRAPPDLRRSCPAVALHCPRRLLRDALVAWLNRAGFRVVGQATDLDALPRLCDLHHPDLVIVDTGAQVSTVLQPLTDLRARYRRIRLVLIHDELPPDQLSALRRSGVDVLVPSSTGLESFFLLLHRRSATVGTEPTGRLTDRSLTPQEQEILTLLGAGHSARHIASVLHLTVSVVESGKRRIYAKLRVSSKTQAVARAVELGLIDPVEPPGVSTTDLPASYEFTAREFDILRSIALGHTVRQTARLLAIAEKTVENLQARLFLKLGTHNRAGAIRAAYALGVLDRGSEGNPRVEPSTAP